MKTSLKLALTHHTCFAKTQKKDRKLESLVIVECETLYLSLKIVKEVGKTPYQWQGNGQYQ